MLSATAMIAATTYAGSHQLYGRNDSGIHIGVDVGGWMWLPNS